MKGYFGVYKVYGEEVEIMAEVTRKVNDDWIKPKMPKIIYLQKNKLRIPVAHIDSEIEMYEEAGRTKKAERLKSYRVTFQLPKSS